MSYASTMETHHYIPIFHIRKFLDKNGGYWVLDKNNWRIARRGPTNSFCESNGNTIKLNGSENSFVEKEYGKIEAFLAPFLEKLAKSENKNEILNSEFLAKLKIFIIYSIWRIPAYEALFKELLNDFLNDRDEKHLQLQTILSPFPIDDQLKLARGFLPTYFLRSPDFKIPRGEAQNFVGLLDTPNHSFVLSDNPVLFKNQPCGLFDINHQMIIPLSSKRILCQQSRNFFYLDNDVILLINNLLIHQAVRFIAFPDLAVLKERIGVYRDQFENQSAETINAYKETLFNKIQPSFDRL